MTLVDFIRLILNNLKILIAVPVVLSTTIFLLTRNEIKTYTSSTTIYTGFASGYTIEGNNKADFFNTAMAFDNLLNITKSRETREEVAIRLIANHLMLDEPDPRYVSPKSFFEFQNLLSPELREKLRDPKSYEKTLTNVLNYKIQSDSNAIFHLLNSIHKFYSIDAITKVSISRVGNSDLVKADYTSEDQSICKNTLEIFTEVFINKYRKLKEAETGTVVNYFKTQTALAHDRLDAAERALLKFRKDNNIINYYEQTRFISAEKEKLDKEYNDQEIALAAAQASMNSINAKLGERERFILNSQEVLQKRNELSDIVSNIAIREINPIDTITPAIRKNFELRRLKDQAQNTKKALQGIVNDLYRQTNSTSGLPVEGLLERWINNAIGIDESNATMQVLRKRKKEFADIYSRMAPLGAELKRIEREIEVSEQEYLSMVHSLNQSKLKQQNIELSSNLKVIDAPFYPTKTKASARMIIVIVGGFGGFVFTLGIVVAMEFLDSTIKYPSRAEDQTGLKLAGAYPKINNRKSAVDFEYVNNRLIEQISQSIKLETYDIRSKNGPINVAVISNRRGEGKTTLSSFIVEKLRNRNHKVLYVGPNLGDVSIKELCENDCLIYEVDQSFYELTSTEKLYRSHKIRSNAYDLAIFEIPALLHFDYPIDFIKNMDQSLMVLRSNRKWNHADTTTFETYNDIVDHTPKAILNGVKIESLESIIGEIPKRRGWLRRTVKRWAKFEFRSRKHF
ncbi:hypothetical protein QQ008_02505 [Fulvivirgaceae bacterium BMA10]|uniref:Polysaccharide chain length determinant N-terminal domain-containing protein n=1 Tax=Splendidivirga corallicola TaxID=3051826 RepID=A0ABT8KKV0_9BACT|nr:hypothetical protein [Fulvivirgaceae bacterium BMA10]